MSDEKRAVPFEDMPNLSDRLRNFEQWLEYEPCTHPGNKELEERRGRPLAPNEPGGCIVISVLSHMCPSCRLRMAFYHCIYNADAYTPEAVAATAERLGMDKKYLKSWLPFISEKNRE